MDAAHWAFVAVGGLALVFSALAVAMGNKVMGKTKKMARAETIKVAEAVAAARPGHERTVELRGKAEISEPLLAPRTGTRCVFFRYKVEELHEETHYRYDSNHGRNIPETTYDWRTVADRWEYLPFLLRDSSGAVLIDPRDAEIVAEETEDTGRGNPNGGGGAMDTARSIVAGALVHMDGQMRYSEWVIPEGADVYVLGEVVRAAEGAVVKKGKGDFIVSAKSEEELTKSLTWKSMIWFAAAALGAIAGVGGVCFGITNKSRFTEEYVTIVLIAVAAAIVTGMVYAIIGLVRKGSSGRMQIGAPGGSWSAAGSGGALAAAAQAPAARAPRGIEVVNCPSCGRPASPNVTSCPNCGWNMDRSTAAAMSTGAKAGIEPEPTRARAETGQGIQVPAAPSETGGRTGVIQRDVIVDGVVAFENGERVEIEAESPDPHRPEYRYVVLSRALNKRFRLSDMDVFS